MQIRDNDWLRRRLEALIKGYFGDVSFPNPVEVKFGRNSVSRYGSIRLTRKKVSRILINGYFKDEMIPERVVMATLAHEMAHYVHGFSSLRPQLYRHPHKNNVVTRELSKRGIKHWEDFEGVWSKANWHKFVEGRRRLEKLAGMRKIRRLRPVVTRRSLLGIRTLPRLITAFLRKNPPL